MSTEACSLLGDGLLSEGAEALRSTWLLWTRTCCLSFGQSHATLPPTFHLADCKHRDPPSPQGSGAVVPAVARHPEARAEGKGAAGWACSLTSSTGPLRALFLGTEARLRRQMKSYPEAEPEMQGGRCRELCSLCGDAPETSDFYSEGP